MPSTALTPPTAEGGERGGRTGSPLEGAQATWRSASVLACAAMTVQPSRYFAYLPL
jgi:hypothetical protein